MTTETTILSAELELTRFELFVQSVADVLAFVQEYAYMGVLLTGLMFALCWLIFRYHEHQLEDNDFFRSNLGVAGRFTCKTYDMFRWCSTTVPPFSFFVLVFSVWTRFDTVRFIRFFGIKRLKS